MNIDDINEDITKEINRAILGRIAEKPTVPIINLEDVPVEVIKVYLQSKRSSTWSTYSIGSEDSLEKAAVWFKRELDSIYAFVYRIDEYNVESYR